jgi:WXG100 protein secretion system (Wss), protein YukD
MRRLAEPYFSRQKQIPFFSYYISAELGHLASGIQHLVKCFFMPQITVTVVRADTNQEYEVELPDDAKLDDLLPQLVQQLGLPLVGPDGNRISYQLSNKRTSQELKQNKTLGEYATKNGDLLLLTSTFVAGN